MMRRHLVEQEGNQMYPQKTVTRMIIHKQKKKHPHPALHLLLLRLQLQQDIGRAVNPDARKAKITQQTISEPFGLDENPAIGRFSDVQFIPILEYRRAQALLHLAKATIFSNLDASDPNFSPIRCLLRSL